MDTRHRQQHLQAQQRMDFMQQLRKFNLPQELVSQFNTVQSSRIDKQLEQT